MIALFCDSRVNQSINQSIVVYYRHDKQQHNKVKKGLRRTSPNKYSQNFFINYLFKFLSLPCVYVGLNLRPTLLECWKRHCYSSPVWEQSIVMRLSVCPCVSQKPHVETSPNFLRVLSASVARPSSGGVINSYVLPVLRMTTCFSYKWALWRRDATASASPQ